MLNNNTFFLKADLFGPILRFADHMTRLSVNVNKIATLRNARGGNTPDLIKAAIDIQRFGSDGITVHPRPDERHIRIQDVYDLKKVVSTEFNIEGYPSKVFLQLLKSIRPTQATLVPDPPDVLTSNAGWNTLEHKSFLQECLAEIHNYGIRTSIFIAPDENMIFHAKETGTDRIELYTEAYAANFHLDREAAIAPYQKAAEVASQLNLGLNAGHDLNLENLRFFKQNIIGLEEVSIGHALISDALYYGLENVIGLYKRQLTLK